MANVLRRAHAFKLASEIIIKDIRSRHEMDSDVHQCIEATMSILAKDKASETETLNAVRSILEKCDKTQSKLYGSTRHD
jgi:bacillopeptidase F (M6 metalloprotease family)